MPEGYPTKSVQTTTLMAEQEVAFEVDEYGGAATLPNPIEIAEGQTYTVKWDGTEYECVCFDYGKDRYLGNNSISGASIDTGEPFVYDVYQKAFLTLDTSASHTISIKTAEEVVTPMAEEFLPATAKNTTVFYL